MRRRGELTATYVRGDSIEDEATQVEEQDEQSEGPYGYYDPDEETKRLARRALKLLTSNNEK